MNQSGWAPCRLGDALETLIDHRGKTPGKLGGAFTDSGVPVISAIHIKNGAIDFSQRARFVTHEMYSRWMRVPLRQGDVLMTSEAPMGSVALVNSNDPLVLSQRLFAMRGREGVLDNRFLRWALIADPVRRQLEARSSGTTVLGIRQSELREVVLRLPSVSHQRRIVDILEDHLSRLDSADASLQQQLSRLEAIRASSIRRATAPGGPSTPLADLLSVSVGGLWGSSAGHDELDVRVVRVTELKRHGELDPSAAVTRSITRKQFEVRSLQFGDLLLEKSGGGPKSPVGRVGLVRFVNEPSICANFMQLMRPNPERVFPRFLHLTLNAFHQAGGTAPMQTASTNIRNIKASDYVRIPLQIPSLSEQASAIAELEPTLEGCMRLERAIVDARRGHQSLRRAVLAAAFSGKLTGRHTDQEAIEELASV